jgi:hypothetical protein
VNLQPPLWVHRDLPNRPGASDFLWMIQTNSGAPAPSCCRFEVLCSCSEGVSTGSLPQRACQYFVYAARRPSVGAGG